MTKSGIVLHGTVTSPRMTSVNELTPSSGVRKRIDRGRPSPASRARSSALSERQ